MSDAEATAATGEVEMVLRCMELEARIALAEERWAEERAAIGERRDRAEGMGFGLVAARVAELARQPG